MEFNIHVSKWSTNKGVVTGGRSFSKKCDFTIAVAEATQIW